MTKRERLLATLQGRPVDRPAVSFYEIGGFPIDPSDPDPFNVYNDPSWLPLLQLAEKQTDLLRMRNPVKSRSCDVELFPKNLPGKPLKVEEYLEQGCRFKRVTLKIGPKTLTSLIRRTPDVDTVWTIEHLLKNVDDLKAFLTLPDELFTENINVAPLIEEDKKLGDHGIVMIDTEDPLCAAASLFSMEDFTIIALTEQDLFHRLLEKLSHYIYTRTEKTASAFPGHPWRIYGPEYATEPYLPPHLFKEYVVHYTSPMIQTIRKYNGFARIHCHGRLRAVLDYFVEMGAAAIEPVEPPPFGDIELAEVRRQYGKDLALFGNIELTDLENLDTPDFEKLVEKILIDGTAGKGRGFVLMPCAAPNGRKITPRVLANYQTMANLAANFRL